MTAWTLIRRSLRFHARAHLGVLLGAAVGSAALVGALVVGDSVRGSLRDRALERLGWIHAAMDLGDRLIPPTFYNGTFSRDFTNNAGKVHSVQQSSAFAVLKTSGTVSRQDGTARANQVNVLGVDPFTFFHAVPKDAGNFFGGVVINHALAQQLHAKPGDEVILRVRKPSALSREAIISPQQDATVGVRLRVYDIMSADMLGDFSLQQNQVPPMNAFVDRTELCRALGLEPKANLLLGGAFQYNSPSRIASWLWKLGPPGKTALRFLNRLGMAQNKKVSIPTTDTVAILNRNIPPDMVFEAAGLSLQQPEQSIFDLRTSRIFLEPPVVEAATNVATRLLGITNTVPVLTYLVNTLRSGTNLTPYSMVTAAGAPYTPADLKDDEIIINQWLAEDLQAQPGSQIELSYFIADSAAQLIERTNRFRVRSVVPMEGIYTDRSLMPDFPGIAKAESTHDWDAGFPITHKIRPKDDAYWKEHRGTPKAFITLEAGQRMWANRFGQLTSIRYLLHDPSDAEKRRSMFAQEVARALKPVDFGLQFQPVREQALRAVSQSQDFGQLFLGFSFFLIVAALILMGLLFQFGLEQRSVEIGTLLALGFLPKLVRRLILIEGCALALVGGIIGTFGGTLYARAMLLGLTTIWSKAVANSALSFHVTPLTLGIGLLASVVVSAATMTLVLRKQARQPARELLSGSSELKVQNSKVKVRSRGSQIGFGAAVPGLGLVVWALWRQESNAAGIFFGASSLFLISGLGFTAAFLNQLARLEAAKKLSVISLGLRNCARRSKRSLATMALLACGSFLVVAVGANRLNANVNAEKRSSGTGGFAFIGESTLPIVHDLNSQAGRDFFGLDAKALQGVDLVSLRVREGDDASCLNLNRTQTPRLLGVRPEALDSRGAFTFSRVLRGQPTKHPWLLLKRSANDDAVPAIGDEASIVWALGKSVGDTLTYVDERGRPFKVRLVGALANSILQGNLLIAEDEFKARFPGESGYRMFLIDAPSNNAAPLAETFSRALQDVGLQLTPAAKRLDAFNAVQNTYLNTFQVLGGLGLLLGSAGLGVMVLRNVLERRAELALLLAVGFRRSTLHRLVLSEHCGLLGSGLFIGIAAALVAVLPAVLVAGSEFPLASLIVTLAAVLVSGLLWTWLATWIALRGQLLEALRNE